ncbi:MAG TPA: THUMP domain-containing protein [Bacteroidia bacterium]|nr:THUMP domain-containing protein [Bacteroidia bacterium]
MFRLVATTFFGGEEILAGELRNLGAKEMSIKPSAVEFYGDEELMYKANLCCRTALRILKPFSVFKVKDEEELYANSKEITWEKFLSAEKTFSITAVSNHEKLNHTLYISQKIKDAIVDRFRDKTGKRPSVDLDNPDYIIHAFVEKDKCTLSLDSSGNSLHKRGYRIIATEAPLNETLAAGLIMLSGWNGERNFYDLMCGSGTFLIEAAMLALNIPPGIFRRSFAFMKWNDFNSRLWEEIVRKAKSEIKTETGIKILGADISDGAVSSALRNIKQAGLEKFISVEKKSFIETVPESGSGIVILNPPYGGRLDDEDIYSLYEEIGNHIKKNFSGLDVWILTANREASKKIGLHSSRKIKIYNGPLECRFMKFEIYAGSKKKKWNADDTEKADKSR